MSQDIREIMEAIVEGRLSDADIETFLLELRASGETAEDLLTAAQVMRKYAVRLSKNYPDLLDTCGTGGDGQSTLNVSTIAAITASAASATVAKHGNRSVSSVCGSADLLEALGVAIDLSAEQVEKMIEVTGFGFFFAPRFHPATRYAMPARRKIQGKTIFNLLGPLANPAGAGFHLMGVYDQKLLPIMAEALLGLGVRRSLVVHGRDGLDEISLCAESHIAEVDGGCVKNYTVAPEKFGFKRASLNELQCSSKEECRDSAIQILKGAAGPKTDIILLNAGAALYASQNAESIAEGIEKSRQVLRQGKAYEKLQEIIRFCKTC